MPTWICRRSCAPRERSPTPSPTGGFERSSRLVNASFARFDLWTDIAEIDATTSAPLDPRGAAQAPSLPAANAAGAADLLAPLDADASQLAR